MMRYAIAYVMLILVGIAVFDHENRVESQKATPVQTAPRGKEADATCYHILSFEPESAAARIVMADNYLTEVECDAYIKVYKRRNERKKFLQQKRETLALYSDDVRQDREPAE